MHKCPNCERLAREKAALRNIIEDLSPTLPPLYGLTGAKHEMLGFLFRHQHAHDWGLMRAADTESAACVKVHMSYIRLWLSCQGFEVRREGMMHYSVTPRDRAKAWLARLMAQDEALLEEIRRNVVANPSAHDKLLRIAKASSFHQKEMHF